MTKRQKEIIGLVFIIFSLVSAISIITYNSTDNPFGLDQNVSPFSFIGICIGWCFYLSLGYPSIVLSIISLLFGVILFTDFKTKVKYSHILHILIISLYFSVFMSFIAEIFNNEEISNFFSGAFGITLINGLNKFIGIPGIIIVLFFVLILIITNIFKISIYNLFLTIFNYSKASFYFLYTVLLKINNSFLKLIKKRKTEHELEINDNSDLDVNSSDDSDSLVSAVIENEDVESNIIEDDEVLDDSIIENNEEVIEKNDNISNGDEIVVEEESHIEEGNLDSKEKTISNYFKYKLPKLEYLKDPIEIVKQNDDELRAKGEQLKYALTTFGVDGEIVKISPGPIISLFEVEPAVGVRVNKFINLSDDLARIMKAQRVRIIAPIPGSKSVGIELPNNNISTVYMKSILNSNKFINSESKLSIALGKTTTGDAYVLDLCKMPHLLVAGATGAGKSVCINTIILSILYKSKPDEVKFILIDPKKLELSTYKSLVGYHLITSPNLDEYVMTTAENSVAILNSAIIEMERRFQVFSDARVRNIDEYHIKQAKDDSLEKIPYIVVLIDELADLMMTSGRSVEEPITRLAQKARAVGIHLVVATQRPSVDVITGLIKSNFPSRISFQVSSKIDSRTIIDQMGAEKLLGRGDMLFLLPGSASPLRLHNAFVTLDEIEQIMNHISSQPKPDEIKLPEYEIKKSNTDLDIDQDNHDEYLKDAAKLVFEYQQASVSLLQRKFRIGYSRAGRLVDELESLGIISSYNGSKAREVLVDQAYIDEIFGEE
jgi:S-DNA-T family DNA segregation ATPase FtsK/SpoIIIE